MTGNVPNPDDAHLADSYLDALELRVLAVLAEKETLTPDNYPLSLNALIAGCNQLTSRDPVMSVTEDSVRDTLQRLMQKRLATEVTQAGARVAKYEHRMRVHWSLSQDKLAILVTLALRGLQTAGEIRTRVGRLHEFASLSEVEAGLQFLIDKYPPVVARLPRAAGAKEPRYGQLLCGEIDEQDAAVASPTTATASGRLDRVAQLEQEVAQMRTALEDLQQQFDRFKQQFE